ncbi:hypothetical protein [Deinococcus aerolatus]|nr:hypothetical protein [Deinococcus aerolatus]
MTEACLTTHWAAGVRVSPNTLRVYSEAIRAFLAYITGNSGST